MNTAGRDALLAEEIELRRHIERVAGTAPSATAGRRSVEGISFEGENGPVSFADLFGDKQTLVIYSYMFGPKRERAVPDVHVATLGVGRRGGRCCAVHCACGGCTLADRAAGRVQATSAAGSTSRCIPIRRATTLATMSAPMMPTRRRSMYSPAATAASAISGAARWAPKRRTRDRIRAARRT